ncbi:MAG: HlyD family efflux transporter periplasmic adaptor subunit [Chryseolinea sp.]
MKNNILFFTSFILLTGCSSRESLNDATGTFEAVETIVSSEASGIIKALTVAEGQILKKGENVGYVDSIQLHLRRKQLYAQIRAVLSKKPNVSKQLASIYQELDHARTEQQRVGRLLKADAATQKQYDDATSQVAILERKIEGQESSFTTTASSLTEETLPLQAQIEQLDDQLSKCRIINEVNGTVLVKYAEPFETTVPGKALYKIADLSELTLKAYITGSQISQVKINQTVKVLIDDKNGKYKEYTGTVEWVSNKAEFTPKTIQTKEERANLVYAIKIRVKNDGQLKIGMYGEVKL